MVEFSYKSDPALAEKDLASLLEPWHSALSALGIDGSPSAAPLSHHRKTVVASLKAAAGLSVISLIVGFVTLVVTSISIITESPPIWAIYLMTMVDGATFVAAAVLFYKAADNGVPAIQDYAGDKRTYSPLPSADYGPGHWVFLGGCALKFLVVAGVMLTTLLVVICPCILCAGCAGGGGSEGRGGHRTSNNYSDRRDHELDRMGGGGGDGIERPPSPVERGRDITEDERAAREWPHVPYQGEQYDTTPNWGESYS